MQNLRKALLANIAVVGIVLSGCSSHLISSGLDDGACAAGQCVTGQTSFAGRAGVSSNGATGAIPEECKTTGFTRVEVRRSFGQGLATILSLGIVNPASLHFSCRKQAQESQIACDAVEGVPNVISCTRKATNAHPEAVEFDCVVTPAADDASEIEEFTCTPSQAALDAVLPLIEQAEAARG